MSVTQYRSPIHRIFEEAFNQGKLAVLDEVFASDHLVHNAFGGAPNGPQDLKWLITMYRFGFPDLHCTVEEEIREDDKFAYLWTMCGTHKGLFLGNSPGGRQMQTQGIIFARFEKEKILGYRMLIDQFDLLQQLGIIPR